MWNEILNDLWRVYRGRLFRLCVRPVYRGHVFNFGFFTNYIFTDLYFGRLFYRQQNR